MSLEEERRQWEVEALRSPLPEDVNCVEESISDVSCVWVSEEKSDTDRVVLYLHCLLYTSPSPRDQRGSRMPSSA